LPFIITNLEHTIAIKTPRDPRNPQSPQSPKFPRNQKKTVESSESEASEYRQPKKVRINKNGNEFVRCRIDKK
jgi:hypothetical protein